MARVVTVVLDREFGERLEPLAFRNPVWIVESDANRIAAARASAKAVDWPQISVTVFRFGDPPAKDEWLTLLRQLEIAQLKPFDVVNVIGSPLTAEMLAALEEAEFARVEDLPEGVRATRR